VERSSMLGGVATAGLMASITNFFFLADDRQVIKGFPEELIESLVARGATSPQWRTHRLPQLVHDPEVFQVVLWQKLQEAGAQVLLYTWVAEPIMEANRVVGLVVENEAGRQALRAKVIVDATGEADIPCRAGAPCTSLETGGDTLMFRMGNVDLEATYQFLREHPQDFGEEVDISTSFADFQANWTDRGIFHFPHGGGRFLSVLQKAIRNGDYAKEKGQARGLDDLGLFGVRGSRACLVNSNWFFPRMLQDIHEVSRATLEGRQRCLELADVLKRVLPGFDNAYVMQTAAELGIRLSRWIEGQETLSWEDVTSARKNPRTIGALPQIAPVSAGIKIQADWFDIPYGVLLPREIDGVLVASGKAISATRDAHARILRGQASCLVLGQAAGTAAALAAHTNVTPRALDVSILQKTLISDRVWLGDMS
jgi:hypothetical protein